MNDYLTQPIPGEAAGSLKASASVAGLLLPGIGSLEALWGGVGWSWGDLGRSWGSLGSPGPSWRLLGGLFGHFWLFLG